MANEQKDISDEAWFLIESIGDEFRRIRRGLRLSQRAAAKKIGTRQARVSGLETGRHDVMLSTIERYASAYGYDVEITLVPKLDDFDDALRDALEEAV